MPPLKAFAASLSQCVKGSWLDLAGVSRARSAERLSLIWDSSSGLSRPKMQKKGDEMQQFQPVQCKRKTCGACLKQAAIAQKSTFRCVRDEVLGSGVCYAVETLVIEFWSETSLRRV